MKLSLINVNVFYKTGTSTWFSEFLSCLLFLRKLYAKETYDDVVNSAPLLYMQLILKQHKFELHESTYS